MYHYLQTIFTQWVNYKMYQINHLNILLMLKKNFFDIIYHDLHQKKMVQPLEHYQTITKNRFKDFGWQTTDYLTTFTRRAERDNLFFWERFWSWAFFWKETQHIFLSAMKKKFYYKKCKITTTEDTKLNFLFLVCKNKMPFDDTILSYFKLQSWMQTWRESSFVYLYF